MPPLAGERKAFGKVVIVARVIREHQNPLLFCDHFFWLMVVNGYLCTLCLNGVPCTRGNCQPSDPLKTNLHASPSDYPGIIQSLFSCGAWDAYHATQSARTPTAVYGEGTLGPFRTRLALDSRSQ
jgi:hypothetical protein